MQDIDPRPQPDPNDYTVGKDGMAISRLEALVDDIRHQPEWRGASDRAAAFYDGHQLTAARIAEMEIAGQPVSVTNLLQRAINGALGMEAKVRLDWKVTSDDDDFQDVASVVNQKLAQAQRETMADMAISDAYKSQIVTGIGWVEVSRSTDPLDFPYRVMDVHRNELWWDWRARRKDLKDSRWVVRQRWVDVDEAILAFPKYSHVLAYCLSNAPLTETLRLTGRAYDSLDRLKHLRNVFRIATEEWFDISRRRVRMYEVWYKVFTKLVAIVSDDGSRQRFNPQNPYHSKSLERGTARLVSGPSYVMRRAIFAGPYRLSDVETDRRSYPYIPFWCYREDDTRAPYGIGEGMISPQEEYNERRSKLLWLLRTAQVFVDNDAIDPKYNNFADLAAEIMRPDAMIVTNPNARQGHNALRVEHNLALAKEQVDVMTDAKGLIQEQPGINTTVLGDAPTGVTSGLAINSLVEQSAIALGETSDNFRVGRRMVGEALAELIVADNMRTNLQAKLGSGKKARVVVLNTFDQAGEPVNHVAAAPLKTGLQDVPSTPAYRMQQQQVLTQVVQALGGNPQVAAVLAPAILETTDIPNKDLYAEWMRKTAGVPDPEDQNDDGQSASEQQQAQMQQMAMEKATADLNEAHARVAELLSRVEMNVAKAEESRAKAAVPLPQSQPTEDDLISQALQEAMQGSQSGEAQPQPAQAAQPATA